MEIIKEVEALWKAVNRGNGAQNYDTTLDMAKDGGLGKGVLAVTKGFSKVNDGGEAIYLIEETQYPWSIEIVGRKLYANIQNKDCVNYRMFGAPLDGINDDGPAMRLCHQYAHTVFSLDVTKRIRQYTCTVKQNFGIIYKHDAESIATYTNMDLSGATLLVDDRNATWFGIYTWGDVNANYFGLELTEEQKASLTEGSIQFPMTDNSIPSNVVINLHEDPYSARDDAGYSYTVGRKELIVHDMNGIFASPITSDWSKAGGRDIKCPVTDLVTGVTTTTSFTSNFETSFTHVPNQHITFIGCDVEINVSPDKYVSVLWVKRHNCTVKDFVFRPHRNSLRNPVFKNSMIYLWDSYNVTVENLQGFNGAGRNNAETGFKATSGYMLRMTNCSDVVVRGCRLLGYWGATAMDSTKNVRFERCQINRIDSHDYISNLYVDDCILFHHGLQIGHGTGMLSITNCTQYIEPVKDMSYTNHLLELNLTYGRIFTGKIYIDNVKVIAKDGPPQYTIMQATFWEKAVAISEKFSMPEITISNMDINLKGINELVYFMIGGKRNGTTSSEIPAHIKGTAIDNTVRWKYVGKESAWSPGGLIKQDDLIKSNNGVYYQCTTNGQLGPTPPTHTTGSATNGSVSMRALGTDIAWKARFTYNMDDYAVIPGKGGYAAKAFKCIQGGVSNGEMPIHLSGVAKDNELTWLYVGKTSQMTKGWGPNRIFQVGDIVLVPRGIYKCIVAGATGSTPPTEQGWFQNSKDGSVTWQYIGGAWEPMKWFDVTSYCDARGNMYQVSGAYGTTSGKLPVENTGTANDGDVIWEDLGGATDVTPPWVAHKQYLEGAKLATDTDIYAVGGGTSGTSNPQFQSGVGSDGTLVIEFIGLSSVWQRSKAYKIGDLVHNGAKIYACTQAGISASTGWGPAMESGGVVDGTVYWNTVTNDGAFRRSSTAYPQGKCLIVADTRVYRVIPGTTSETPPTHKSGSVYNGTVNLIWESEVATANWQPKTRYEVGNEVIINGRSYRCVSNGILESSRRILFDNIDTNINNVSAIMFKEGTDVRTSLKDGRLEIIVRDCHGIETEPKPVWFGRADNPQPTKSIVK